MGDCGPNDPSWHEVKPPPGYEGVKFHECNPDKAPEKQAASAEAPGWVEWGLDKLLGKPNPPPETPEAREAREYKEQPRIRAEVANDLLAKVQEKWPDDIDTQNAAYYQGGWMLGLSSTSAALQSEDRFHLSDFDKEYLKIIVNGVDGKGGVLSRHPGYKPEYEPMNVSNN